MEMKEVLEIKSWKWNKIKSAYREYSQNKWGIKLQTPMSSDELCKVASYLNHNNSEWGVVKFNKLIVRHVKGNGLLHIPYVYMPF